MAHPERPGPRAAIAAWRQDLRSNLAAAKAWESGLWRRSTCDPYCLRYKLPTLVLTCELDRSGASHGRLIAQLIDHAEMIEEFPTAATSFRPAEKPEAFLLAVTSFCGHHAI